MGSTAETEQIMLPGPRHDVAPADVRHRAAVAPRTVTETSRRILDDPDDTVAQFRRKRTARPDLNGPVEVRTLAHPDVYAACLELAGGDVKRLDVRSWTDVRVLNKPRP